MKVAIAGTGYVGLVTGVCLAEIGHENIVCVDIDKNKVELMKSGISPIYEADLEELMVKNYESKRLDYTTDYKKAYEDAAKEGVNPADLCPIAADEEGKIIIGPDGKPLPVYFNFGGDNYKFKGGDVIYEDINHDGNINQLDIVYLGNSNPKAQGGFGFTFNYGRWALRTNFNYRYGVDVINSARMNVENMYTNYNQSTATNWRWRKEGDVTSMPRALYQTGYNWLGSDRYVEDASFLRLSYLNLTYNVDPQLIKKYGLTRLSFNGSVNNLFVWTKYTGLDPEIGQGSWGRAYDNAKTPRSRSFSLTLSLGF